MRETLVQARVGVRDLREGVAATRARLDAERSELETIRRRRGLAEKIRDAETVSIAERYERQHEERVSVLERKLEAQEAELGLAEAEVQEMTSALKGAVRGGAPAASIPLEDPLADDLLDELSTMDRLHTRASAEAEADEKLAALKRRMGK